jgi:hypothetical protein
VKSDSARCAKLDKDRALIEEVIRQRLEGIKQKNPPLIASTIKTELYTKFDDWTPKLQVGQEALTEEEAALKVLTEYNYQLSDLRIELQGEYAWASFYLNYEGVIRSNRFKIQSRVSIILLKENEDWRIVHEHFSTMPTALPIHPIAEGKPPPQPEAKPLDELGEIVLTVLRDGVERSAREIATIITEEKRIPVDVSDVVGRCRQLIASGTIQQSRGGLYPRYKIITKSGNQT